MAIDRRVRIGPRPPGPPQSAPPRRPGIPPSGARSARPMRPAAPALPVVRLVLLPAIVTLAVTLARLVGELRHGPARYFSPLPGGGLALVGITWLVPLVGLYFGWQLGRVGLRPPSAAQGVGRPVAALVAGSLAALLVGRLLHTSWTANFTVWAAVSLVVTAVAYAGWPDLGRPLLAYALAARIPVAALMLAAIHRGWGTHYDAPPPGFPAMAPLRRWLWTGLLPQTTIWVAFTVSVGVIFGVLGGIVTLRRRA